MQFHAFWQTILVLVVGRVVDDKNKVAVLTNLLSYTLIDCYPIFTNGVSQNLIIVGLCLCYYFKLSVI